MRLGSTLPVARGTGRHPVLRRALDLGYRSIELATATIDAVRDPRARKLRQRRRALRWGVVFTAGCLFWTAVTALLASWPTPVWGLLITGVIAAGAAFPATLLLLRYRRLRSVPLPAQQPGTSRRLPPVGSAARPSMWALGASERGLFSLLAVLERGELLPAGEISELTGAANRTAATMAATAAQVVSMEQAVQQSPEAQAYLVPTINAFTAQLGAGVRQYNEMVTAAAQLVATANAMPAKSAMSEQYHDELVGATDRMLGWAQAFDELGRVA